MVSEHTGVLEEESCFLSLGLEVLGDNGFLPLGVKAVVLANVLVNVLTDVLRVRKAG